MPTLTGHTNAIRAGKAIGTNVYDRTGKKIGDIKDIVLEKTSNNILFAVVSFGGLLGMGEKYHPVPWGELDYDPNMGGYVVSFTAEQVKNAKFARGQGCNYCHHTGYRGRKGIFEMMSMNSTIREMTFNREPTQSIRKKARQTGMRTLLEDGLAKALTGMTTLDEVLSICHHETGMG